MGLSHFALYFRARNKSRNGVHDYNVNRTGAYHCFGNFQSLLAIVRLRKVYIVYINPEVFRVQGVKGVLGINIAGNSAHLLHLGNKMKCYSCFT